MEISHVISDAVLAAVGFFVFFNYIAKLDLLSTILWESFILSISIAALLGAIKFAGYLPAGEASLFFQKLATTVGALCLIAASYQLVSGKLIDRTLGYVIIGIGFALLAITEIMDFTAVRNTIALVCLPIVGLLGIWAFTKGKSVIGSFLVGGVLFAAAAFFTPQYLENGDNGIDVYHYLLAISVLCFGLAAAKQPQLREL